MKGVSCVCQMFFCIFALFFENCIENEYSEIWMVWHLDVGSSHPGAGLGPKGLAVRQLKRHASWVQNVVRQFGPYPSWAQES